MVRRHQCSLEPVPCVVGVGYLSEEGERALPSRGVYMDTSRGTTIADHY